MTLEEFARDLVERHRALLKKDKHPWKPLATPATDLGYRCERRIAYHRLRPLEAREVSEELLGIFGEGDLHERDVRRKLDELGVELVENQRNFRDERLEISGTVDGKVVIERRRRVPLEIKSTQGEPPHDEEEWRQTETPLLRRYYAQLQVYMFLTGEPEALALFKDKGTGLWAVIPVRLDYELAESLLQRAERVRDAVRAFKAVPITVDQEGNPVYGPEHEAALPPRLLDRSECASCPWFHLCLPGDAAVDPLLVAEDLELVAQVDRHQLVKPNRDEYEALHERLKERFKLTKGDRFVVGDWLVTKRKHGAGVRLVIERLPSAPAPAQLSTGSD